MAASIPVFQEKLESWESYKERLEHYFIALDIDDPTKKKSILINCVGPANYERLRNVCFPSSPNDKIYEELLEMLSKLFTPSVVVFKERKEFYHARKYKTEKATAWHERIHRLALNCKFGARTEEALLDKFVTSFEGVVFDRFCEEDTDLTLAKALEIAQRYETVEAPTTSNPQKYPPKKPMQQKNADQNPNPNQKQYNPKGPSDHQQNQNQPGQQTTKPKKFYPKNNVNKPVTKVEVNLNVKKN